jgi:sugar lactone lactonase YvrE
MKNVRTNLSAGLLLAALGMTATSQAIAQEYTFTTMAGPDESPGATDGTASTARFGGGFYFGLCGPCGVAVDSAGKVYVADSYNQTIRKVTPDGVVRTLAGLAGSYGGADGTGSAARFNYPSGLAVDSAGNVYVADTSSDTIRKVTAGGVVTTLAGLAGSNGSSDGTGNAARFRNPSGVAVDGAGNVYVADRDNETIRKVTPGGVVTTLAGNAAIVNQWGSPIGGYADGTGSAARFNWPSGVAVDSAGNVYVADTGSFTIRKVAPGGVVTTLAGLAGSQGSADGTGSAAQFNGPHGVAVDSATNLYVADTYNCTIRKVTSSGVVTTLAGLAGSYGTNDGMGSAAQFNSPSGVAVDSAGNVYVADTGNHTIRKVTPGGVVTTLAGRMGSQGSTDGTGSAAQFNSPSGVAVDNAGNLYVADTGNHTIRRVTPSGVVTTLAGLAGNWGSADGTDSAAQFNNPSGLALDGAGNVYVADFYNCTIRKVTPGGVVTTLAGLAGNSGSTDGTGNAARFCGPKGVAVDNEGNVYVADTWNRSIRKVAPGGVVTTLGGLAGSCGSADGTGSAARFGGYAGLWIDAEAGPEGLAVDSAGNLYVADTYNNTIRLGSVACPDTPTIDRAVGPVAHLRQLDTRPQTAVAWQWRLIREPSGSTAALSAANIRNPTFVPDVADLYVFRLEATDATGAISIRTLDFTAVLPPPTILLNDGGFGVRSNPFGFNINWASGMTVVVEASPSLTNPTWYPLGTNTLTSGSSYFSDPQWTNYPSRFYRIRSP